ncbi:spore germination protein GerPB [Bacillus sp. B1-b2]|uniref:spore germination protein GerPB n=1 Tax=Bacillus sp. B1-b2 TaxID=2653201 RepID=UPI001262A3F1|nr:spore germination protein GerPB [Bacillus sp. B1-b2]KAB7665391.1 spore gernimation protein [Bacillus sp. B1-b2]
MNYFIQQSIIIQTIRIGGISNSSVFQIGSSGIIKPTSYLYNSGGFSESAPELKAQDTPGSNVADEEALFSPAVPLQAPR